VSGIVFYCVPLQKAEEHKADNNSQKCYFAYYCALGNNVNKGLLLCMFALFLLLTGVFTTYFV
jgi:hypothetical protein